MPDEAEEARGEEGEGRRPLRLTCWECQLLHYDSGPPYYSDWTPGRPAELECTKGHWQMGEDDLHEAIFQAETCKDFERPQKEAADADA